MNTLIFNSMKDFLSMKGKALPESNWYKVTQQMINDFANATLDKQWIHVDENRAEKESPFKSTVAHGFMSVSMISKLLEESFSVKSIKMGLNYGLNKARFPNPVPVNSQLRMISMVKDIEEISNNGFKVTFICTIEIKGQDKPACVAEFIAALFE
ncbi:MAG: MaoC family dehydratase [Polaribacter sp.]|jgi:acyl dehydratase|uniref:MaoC family dehydratase n=1 Tax=Polaribacter sp. TaxID=1920175 RepID=UPI0026107840|nr:MaoC family dehydratase [Polaribacter sp.]MBT3741632.1 MaoC family dehydratase [Polaribacter sp.]MBT4413999.1 MaoC family dehydratase [Polaribacter sp.]MBT7815419.1 MaoC family dehydratase [Polaribacter sp.]MDG1195483.1 MaoC family dehydratase [Polaribacter sp.]MDG1403370.1 MaoC family dehydratase [Polaribacter sp.]